MEDGYTRLYQRPRDALPGGIEQPSRDCRDPDDDMDALLGMTSRLSTRLRRDLND